MEINKFIELKIGVFKVDEDSILKAREYYIDSTLRARECNFENNNFKYAKLYERFIERTNNGELDNRPAMQYKTLQFAQPELLENISYTHFMKHYLLGREL